MPTTTSTILLAEEHDATRAFLADNLTADGYRVLIAPDRAKALALLSTAHPDLILVDVNGADARAARRDPLRRGARRPGRPGHAADRAEPRRGPAAADPGARARRRRRRPQAVRLPGAARPDRRGAAALGDAAVGADPARGADRDRRPLARGARVRPAGRAVGQGVRPARHARRRADEGVHPRGADARRLGASDVRAHPDARQPRARGCGASCAATATTSW